MMAQVQRSVDPDLQKDQFESLFLLKKSSDSSATSTSIKVDFSPPSQKDKDHQQNALKSLPVFNLDGKHYTPAFIVQLDKAKYQQNQEIYLTLHNRKTTQISEQKTDLFVPRPSRNNSFCCVCRAPFEDYLTHVNIPKHQFLMKKSQYHTRIFELCSLFNDFHSKPAERPAQEKKKRGRPTKTKEIAKPEPKKTQAKKISIRQSVFSVAKIFQPMQIQTVN